MAARPKNVDFIEILSDDDESDGDEGGVVPLSTPPTHLKRPNNRARPIAVDISDAEEESASDEDEVVDEAAEEVAAYRRSLMMDPGPAYARVKRRRSDETSASTTPRAISADAAAPHKRPRVDFVLPGDQAGPSRQAATPVAGPSHQNNETHTAPQPSPETYVAQIMEVLPDICPDYAMREVLAAAGPANHGVENIVAKALEEGYPKAADTQRKAKKTQRVEPGQEEGYKGKVFRAIQRRGREYHLSCLQALEQAFPSIPMTHIRNVMFTEAALFGPSYLHLRRDEQANPKPYKPLTRGRLAAKPKGKQTGVHFADDVFGEGLMVNPDQAIVDGGRAEFDMEKNWILSHVAQLVAKADAEEAQRLADEQEIADGGGLECGCCFGEYVWANMYQCQEGHLFCKECSTKHAETRLGDQEHTILCMDTDGCQALFGEAELSRLLSTKSLELYHRLKLAKELELAAIEGLENCPFCPWAVVIDNPHEKLFRCDNDICRKVSCRACKNAEHLPKSCKEAEVERMSGGRHAVEDAMSEALIRKCPKCAKPYIKDSGCNKITCVKCGTISCYICQKAVKDYSHFDSQGQYPFRKNDPAPRMCPLWDRQEAQHDNENIIAARDAAVQAQRDAAAREGVNINEEDLRVDAPAPAPAAHPPHAVYLAAHGLQHMLAQIPDPNFALNLPPPNARVRQQPGRAIPMPYHERNQALRDILIAHPGPRGPPAQPAPLARRQADPHGLRAADLDLFDGDINRLDAMRRHIQQLRVPEVHIPVHRAERAPMPVRPQRIMDHRIGAAQAAPGHNRRR